MGGLATARPEERSGGFFLRGCEYSPTMQDYVVENTLCSSSPGCIILEDLFEAMDATQCCGREESSVGRNVMSFRRGP
jgi:hypothetical protein